MIRMSLTRQESPPNTPPFDEELEEESIPEEEPSPEEKPSSDEEPHLEEIQSAESDELGAIEKGNFITSKNFDCASKAL